ncbi:MAG: hypothetical protein P4N41_05285 [Negativicutes bacterium]|nr:hypothetical protein [Negativicutes bacterium]
MDIRTTIIAPFDSLYQTALEVIEERKPEWSGAVNAVLLASMSAGVMESHNEVSKGTEVIISRGHTEVRFAGSVDVPVVHIGI